MLQKLKDLFSHNMFLTVAAILTIGAGVWLVGCESSVKSPFTPEQKVTRDQLSAQVESYNALVKLAVASLDKQDLFRQYLVNEVLAVAQGSTLNPSGIIVGLVGLLGVGAVVDNRRKDTVIKVQKSQLANENPEPTATITMA
jgi:outer membrane murein-binding lipoprotein Lpp